MSVVFVDLPENVLLHFIQYLNVKDILSTRQTCRHLNELTRDRIIWVTACNRFVVDTGIPFPYESLNGLDSAELERRTRFALALEEAWSLPVRLPRRRLTFMGGPLNGLLSVHFMLRRENEWIITLSEGIWPVITCWDLQHVQDQSPTKVGEWFCKEGAIITSVSVDSNMGHDTCLAVSVDQYSKRKKYIEIQKITVIESHKVLFETVKVIDTDHTPILLDGDILVTSDEFSETRVLNWRTGDYSILRGTEEPDEVIQHNACLQVLFAHKSIFVARSRSIDLFPEVALRPPEEAVEPVHALRSCTFGWIDGIAMTTLLPKADPVPPVGIFIRAEHSDPWNSAIHFVKFYRVHPSSIYSSPDPSQGLPSPYQFPPTPEGASSARRDFARCPTLALGPAGTALWVSSSSDGIRSQHLCSKRWLSKTATTLADEDVRAGVGRMKIVESGGEMWTSMDYVESRGCIALGAVNGSVTVLYLA